MDSIAEKTEAVQQSEFQPNRNEYLAWRNDVYEALHNADMDTEADEFLDCSMDNACYTIKHETIKDKKAKDVLICTEDPTHGGIVVRHTCHLRYCPECAKRMVARFQSRFIPAALALKENYGRYRFKQITLTTPLDLRSPDAKSQLKWFTSRIPKMFDALLDKGWRKKQGYIVSAEFGPEGQKLHFHILFYGQYINQNARDGYNLRDAWYNATAGKAEIVHIKEVALKNLEHAIIEIIKYSVKFWKKDNATGEIIRIEPALVPILSNVLKGYRRVRTGGIFYRLPDAEREPRVCECCGSRLHLLYVTEWNHFVEYGCMPAHMSSFFSSNTGNKSPPNTQGNTVQVVDKLSLPPAASTKINQTSMFPSIVGNKKSYNPYEHKDI